MTCGNFWIDFGQMTMFKIEFEIRLYNVILYSFTTVT